MTTNDNFLFSKNKQQSFVDNSFTKNESQYSNLNLNQNFKVSTASPIQSYSKSFSDKKLANSTISESYEEKSQKRNESAKTGVYASSNSIILSNKNEADNRWKKKSPTNNSTLSLHIAAYENSIEATASDSFGEKKKFTVIRNKQALFPPSSFVIQNPFEFPRQQSDKKTEPEVSQYKASQQVLHLYKTLKKDKQGKNMPKTSPLLPPPPPPPVITLDDDDDDDEKKEDGELSDEGSNEIKPKANRRKPKKSKKKKDEEVIPDTPAEGSDIECVGDNIFDIDDNGADDEGLDSTMNIDDDEYFKKIQQASGIYDGDLDITINIAETPKANRGQGTCFNCGGPHVLGDCTLPHDRRKINKNRQSFGSTRRERITERTESKYVPGKLSEEALNALNLYEDEYPQWILRMREMGPFEGYPPAYLKRFKPSEKRLSFYCDDPNLTNEVVKAEIEFDADKIIYYDGFNLIDRHSEAERRCNMNVRRDEQWKKWNKVSYANEFERFLKESIKKDKFNESRKRHHSSDNQAQYSGKKETRREAKKEKRAAERKAEKERKQWITYKQEEARQKLMEDLKNTSINDEPEKFHMIDESIAIFASKKQRKKMDRGKSRSVRSLEEEANWINSMQEQERAAAKAKAEREELAKQERAANKPPPKSWEVYREEKRAQRKAEREERDKHRLRIDRKLIETGTQTDRVRILPWIDGEDNEEAAKIPTSVQQQLEDDAHSARIMSKLLPFLSVEAKVVKEELNDEGVDSHGLTSSELSDLRTFPKRRQEQMKSKKGGQVNLQQTEVHESQSKTLTSAHPTEIVQVKFDDPKKIETPISEKEEQTYVREPVDEEIVDIVTIKKQQHEKLLAVNAAYVNASKSFSRSNIQNPPLSEPTKNQAPKKKAYSSDEESSDESIPEEVSTKPKEKKPLINPPVSKEELEKFKKSNRKSESSASTKDTVTLSKNLKKDDKQPLQISSSSSKASLPPKQEHKGKQQYGSDPNLSKTKIPIKLAPTTQKEKQPIKNPPISKQGFNKSEKSKNLPVEKNVKASKNDQPKDDAKAPNKRQQQQAKKESGAQNSAKNSQSTPQSTKKQEKQQSRPNGNPNNEDLRTYPKRNQEQNKSNNKKKGQRNDPPMEEEDFNDYGAPLTNAEAKALIRMPLTDSKLKVSAPRKQVEKEKGRYKHDPPIPSSKKKYENKGRYDYSDANAVTAAGPSRRSGGNEDRSNSHAVVSDTPASPDLPPVISKTLTEDQAAPKNFLVPVIDTRKMPKPENFAAGITPFQYDNQTERKGTLDALEALIKSVKKD
uniref:PSP proline-rich domain-containing protein n=1 Tax=Panagrolaimus sp. PS1159 TaxID=55785 RepID=A0AC35EX84_9BILA